MYFRCGTVIMGIVSTPNSIFNYMVDSSSMSIMHLLYFLFDIQ